MRRLGKVTEESEDLTRTERRDAELRGAKNLTERKVKSRVAALTDTRQSGRRGNCESHSILIF